MSKTHLIFDTTDAATIAATDSVGAYVRAADGTLITKTTEGAKEGLDVYVVNPSIAVTATDLDIRNLTQADEVTVFQGTSPWVVSATDLDIRDIDASQDNIQSWVHDGTGNAITSTAGALDVNLKSPITVDVSLSHLNDSVRLGDGTSLFTSTTVGADIGLDVNIINSGLTINDAALANTAIATAQNALDVANTAEDLVASPLANRKYLFAQNIGNRVAYIGASGVTASNGYPIHPGSEIQMRAGAAIDIEWVSANTSQKLATLELA